MSERSCSMRHLWAPTSVSISRKSIWHSVFHFRLCCQPLLSLTKRIGFYYRFFVISSFVFYFVQKQKKCNNTITHCLSKVEHITWKYTKEKFHFFGQEKNVCAHKMCDHNNSNVCFFFYFRANKATNLAFCALQFLISAIL